MPVHADANGWLLETAGSAYACGLSESGLLLHRYWGPRLPRHDDYPAARAPREWSSFESPEHQAPEEYPCHGGRRYQEPCLKVTFADGTRDLVPRFIQADSPEPSHLELHLRDVVYPLAITLHYRLHEAYDLIERWVELANLGDEPITLERAWSAQWHLPPAADWWLSHLEGRWNDEWRRQRDHLGVCTFRLESRRLTTSHQHNNWFSLDHGASEDTGEVWFGALAWSGNWALAAERTAFGATRLAIGLNDWDFAWRLEPGERFVTPPALAGYTARGFTGASHALHGYIRDMVLPRRGRQGKVLYNSWEATEFAVDTPSQIALAKRAAAMGVELFVLDDGWFHGRTGANAGLGDWWADEGKFPQGLAPLIAAVNGLGMDFGLWIEPEMVNPDSDLYRAHPEWVIHFPTRERTLARGQAILNLGREDVQEYLIGILDTLLATHPIAFIKWDMNRNVSEPGWPEAPGDPRELWVRYVHGLYYVWDTLRKRHPSVVWQTCSGGGGRVDLAILQRADQAWTSDNTDALARLGIQHGFSHAYPACAMEAWVTDSSPSYVPLAFRFHVAMCGALGIGGNLHHWTKAMRAKAATLVAQYKDIRHLVAQGNQYRLGSPREEPCVGVLYMARDRSEGVLFAFRTHLPYPATMPILYPRGLEPDRLYAVEGIEEARSGLAWMRLGIALPLGDFQSTMRRIRAVM